VCREDERSFTAEKRLVIEKEGLPDSANLAGDIIDDNSDNCEKR
jgi:hypothetical protein